MATPQELARMKAEVPAAQASAKRWGVPASVTLAQWMPESSWGTSKLALLAKNYFGIKHNHLNSSEPYVEMPTPEYENGVRVIEMHEFKRYDSEAGSFDDHGRLLATAPRYHAAMLAAADPFQFVEQMAKAGYSTTPTYAADLQQLMREHNLTQYDITPPAQPAAKAAP